MKEKGKNFTGLQTFWSDIAVIMVLLFVIIYYCISGYRNWLKGAMSYYLLYF